MNRFSGWSRARRSFVSPGAFAALFFLLLGGCVMSEPAFAAAHLTVYVQPYGVDLSTQGALAVGEVVPVEVRGIRDGTGVSGWVGAVTKGTNVVGVCTNLVLATNNVATGSVDCATVEMAELFKGAGPLAERDVTLTFCEQFGTNGDFRLVASGSATVRNNPLSPEAVAGFVPTGQHLWDSALFEALREWVETFADERFGASIEDLRDATNDLHSAVSDLESMVPQVSNNTERLDSLYVVNAGGYHYPDYFTVAAQVGGDPVETVAISTNTTLNAVETLHDTTSIRGWILELEIVRQREFGTGVEWEAVQGSRFGGPQGSTLIPSIDPANLAVEGGEVRFAEGYEPVVGQFAAVRGRLGDFERNLELTVTGDNVSSSGQWQWDGWVNDSLIGDAKHWSELIADTYPNRTSHTRTWPEGYGSGTEHVPAGWAESWLPCGKYFFSCVSYHTDTAGFYKPLTLVTPRHAICANHWKPAIGSNVYWVGSSGAIYTNRVVAYRNLRGDLTVARLAEPMNAMFEDSEVIRDITLPYLLPDDYEAWFYGCEHGGVGCPGVPCVSLNQIEQAWVTYWQCIPAMKGKRSSDNMAFTVRARGAGTAHGRQAAAVGGDSGSPTFLMMSDEVLDDADDYARERPILLGCFHWASTQAQGSGTAGGPIPFLDEVNEAIAEWGDDERTEAYPFESAGFEKYNPGMVPW